MSKIQPGTGYTFSASSSGMNLNIEQPFDDQFFPYEPDLLDQLPAQLVEGPQESAPSSNPFECWIITVNGQRYLQIATGTASYSASNMPLIRDGAFTHIRQAWFNKVQICPDGMRTDYNDIWPSGDPDPYPAFSNTIMEGGGGFLLSDTEDPVTLYAFKWDVDAGVSPFSGSSVVNTGLPTLALIAQSNSTDDNKLKKDCGPSVYEQAMNIQPMTGYKNSDTELVGDWGHCHTTWLTPRKFGYNLKAIATVTPSGAGTFSCFISTEQNGVPLVCNTILRVILSGAPSGGDIIFSYDGIPSAIPFPATTTYSPFYDLGPGALALFTTLNAIPALTGNVQVSGKNGHYFVTFLNELQGTPINLLTADVTAVTHFEHTFEIVQYVTGNVDLTTPMQMGMTQLMNVKDLTEADDPYNQNKDGSPVWKNICNRQDVLDCTDFTGDVITEGVYTLNGAEDNNPDFTIVEGCTGPVCAHPFEVHSTSTESEWTVCEGTVNNIIPDNIGDVVTLSTDGYIWLEVTFTSPEPTAVDSILVDAGATVPADTSTAGYIAIAHIVGGSISQLVTGSLWSLRVQFGTDQPKYYFNRI